MTSALATQQSTVPNPDTVEPWDLLWADPGTPADALVFPCNRLHGAIRAQPSKNYTTRHLLAAGLCEGRRILEGLATSDDAAAMVRVLESMGARITLEDLRDAQGRPQHRRAIVDGFGANPRLAGTSERTGVIDVGNAGAVLRLALGIGCLLPEVTFTTTHHDSLGRRPNADLLHTIQSLGIRVESGEDGRLPVTLRSQHRIQGSEPLCLRVSGSLSSQFLSSLLFLAPHLGVPITIEVTGGNLVSQPAVQQTLEILRANGIQVTASPDMLTYRVQPGVFRGPATTTINGDWPGSSAILAAATLLPGEVTIHGLQMDAQGERLSQQVLAAYGAKVQPLLTYRPLLGQVGLTIQGGNGIQNIEFDGDPLTDAVLAMLAPACFAEGTTRIFNVHNLRIKECDRISEPLAELRKIGVQCHEGHEVQDPDPDSIHITGKPEGYDGGVTVEGRGDHRVIMLLTVVGLRTRKGLRIRGAHHVAKSYPGFFRDLHNLGANCQLVPPFRSHSVFHSLPNLGLSHDVS